MKPASIVLILFSFLTQYGAQDSIAYSIDLDEFVLTAQYEPTHYKSAIHRVEVLDRKTITNRGAVTLDQALQSSSSVRLYNDPVLGTSIRMRGIGASNVAVLIDGVPVIGRLDGAVDISQIPMQNVERIEIVEGALSNIYGNNAAGGVINIITTKSQLTEWQGNFSSQAESSGQFTARLGFKSGALTTSVHGRHFKYDQYPVDSLRLTTSLTGVDGSPVQQAKFPFNPKEQWGFGGLMRYELSNDGNLVFKYDRNHEHVNDYGNIRRPQFNPYATDYSYITNREDLSLQLSHRWSDFYLELLTSYNMYDREVEEGRYYLESMEFDSLLSRSDTSTFNSTFNKLILSYDATDDIQIVGGFNYYYEKATGDRISDEENPESAQAAFTEWAPFIDIKKEFGSDLSLSASARYTHHNVYSGKLTPGLHLRYAFNKKLTVRASYAQGYRSPTLKELYLEFIDINHNIVGSTDLRPETSHDLQMTIDYEAGDNILLSVNAYNTIIKDQIGLVEYETLKFRYGNIDSYEVRGIQPALQFEHNGWRIESAGSLSFWSTNMTSEAAPAYGTVFDLNNSVSYTDARHNWGLTVNHRHTGSQPNYRLQDEDIVINTIEAYDLIDVSVNKKLISNRLNFILGIRNLLNITAAQINNSGGDTGMHGPVGRNIVGTGRSVFLSASYSL